MGISVSDTKMVTPTDAHERQVVTSHIQAPYIVQAGNVMVHCIFQRTKFGDIKRDGNPLIYALKGTFGYRIDKRWKRWLHRRAVYVARKVVFPGAHDIIIPLPSSKDIARTIARSARIRLGPNAIVSEIFRKPTVAYVLENSPVPTDVPAEFRVDYKMALNELGKANPRATFKMGKITPRVRHLLECVDIEPSARLPHWKRIILVDDLFASGATIACAERLLARYFKPVSVVGLALLGPLVD